MSLVAIVGRPNVGKSTLFNRLVGQRKAIVDATAGTTRDRHYGKTDWNGREFSVIDTGGYSVNSDDIFEDDIRRQVMLAIEEADVILFLVEVNTGITDLDQMMADILRRTSKKVLLVCNKVDNYDLIYSSHEFYSLGLGEPYCISSMSGSGTGDLMDEIVRDLPPETKNEEEELPRITIVGRPNVGKSSLTNALLGEERNIVTPIPGTTRDAIHSRYNKYGLDFYLVDTAGMRKKGKVTEDLEFYSVMRSIRAIEESDVCILMLDAQQGLESQDLNIHNLIVRNRKGCVIVVSHDRYFVDKVADHLLVFCGGGEIREFAGTYSDYTAWKRDYEAAKQAAVAQEKAKSAASGNRGGEIRKSGTAPAKTGAARKLTFQEKREMERLEAEIPELEQENAAIEENLSSGDLPFEELTALSERITALMDQIDTKSMRWLELSEIGG